MTHGNTIGGGPPAAAAREVPVRDGLLRPETTRLPSLTGLRFPAALLVFLNHTGLPFPGLRLLKDNGTTKDWFELTKNAGSLGVTFFFVLSGFVLTWSARARDTSPAFWRRRFVKIYPNYVVTWVLAMVLFASAYTPTRTAVANLFMVQVWVPKFDVFSSVNTPSWSLGCELVFYACFPLLHHLFQRIPVERLKYWIGGLTALVIATPAITYAVFPDKPYFPGGEQLGAHATVTQYWFAYFLPPVRMVDFALGMLVALAVMKGRWWNIGMLWSTVLLVGGYVLASHVPFLYSQRSTTIIPIVFLIAAAATADVKGSFSLFRNRTMVWLGEISFAFYLIHFIVLTYGRKWLGHDYYSTAQTTGLLAAMFAISVLAAWALYALVERPITRGWSRPRRTRASAGSAGPLAGAK
ncbi:acyltransferase [Streptomyces sp. TLI_146]|uniref:acyltransferase family protein n=1 Tax=Streptomyces sp. TLI_146 TaxID=1938858 RepID=UPI000C708CDA|nr:acyltransferase [Streptomyces sp. TLI_146]PKV87825.1 peptidoglycan/LPS O-acetylase OafA/YrhL [Streptomyces sp. TLI_146]